MTRRAKNNANKDRLARQQSVQWQQGGQAVQTWNFNGNPAAGTELASPNATQTLSSGYRIAGPPQTPVLPAQTGTNLPPGSVPGMDNPTLLTAAAASRTCRRKSDGIFR